MLAAFICVLITEKWETIKNIYEMEMCDDPNAKVYIHLEYTSSAIPFLCMNTNKNRTQEGYGVAKLEDEYFNPEKESKMYIAYKLADSLG